MASKIFDLLRRPRTARAKFMMESGRELQKGEELRLWREEKICRKIIKGENTSAWGRKKGFRLGKGVQCTGK